MLGVKNSREGRGSFLSVYLMPGKAAKTKQNHVLWAKLGCRAGGWSQVYGWTQARNEFHR